MTKAQNIKAILECNFAGFKEEIIDIAVSCIMSLDQEPCEDAISRQAAIEKIHWLGLDQDTAIKCDLALRAMPPVTPKQRTGHWEMCEDADGIYGVCDICGTDADFSHYGKAYPYCPNCGAKMVEPQESEVRE